MSAKQWTREELQQVKNGNRWLTTLLANKRARSGSEIFTIASLPIGSIKRYVVTWKLPIEHTTDVYATDDDMLWTFIDAEYPKARPDVVHEVITNLREVAPQKSALSGT